MLPVCGQQVAEALVALRKDLCANWLETFRAGSLALRQRPLDLRVKPSWRTEPPPARGVAVPPQATATACALPLDAVSSSGRGFLSSS